MILRSMLFDVCGIRVIFLTVVLTLLGRSAVLLSLRAVSEPHQAAAAVLPRSDHSVPHRKVHGGTGVRVVSVEQAGAVLLLSNQLQIQEVLEEKSRVNTANSSNVIQISKHTQNNMLQC